MGLLESLVAGIEKLGEDKTADDDEAHRKVAERLATQEQAWVKAEVAKLMRDALPVIQGAQGDFAKLIEANAKISSMLEKFGEEAFQRGAKAASRMNVIST